MSKKQTDKDAGSMYFVSWIALSFLILLYSQYCDGEMKERQTIIDKGSGLECYWYDADCHIHIGNGDVYKVPDKPFLYDALFTEGKRSVLLYLILIVFAPIILFLFLVCTIALAIIKFATGVF